MSKLSWKQNADEIIKKGRKRLFLLRFLRSYNVTINVMIYFYLAVIESILTTNILVCFWCTDNREIKIVQSFIRTAEGVIGTFLSTIQSINESGTYY